MRYFFCALLGGALLAGVPAAAQKKGADPERQFRKADRNGDGKVTLEEFKGKGDNTKREKAFRKRDNNGDGALSLEEFTAAGQKGKKRKR